MNRIQFNIIFWLYTTSNRVYIKLKNFCDDILLHCQKRKTIEWVKNTLKNKIGKWIFKVWVQNFSIEIPQKFWNSIFNSHNNFGLSNFSIKITAEMNLLQFNIICLLFSNNILLHCQKRTFASNDIFNSTKTINKNESSKFKFKIFSIETDRKLLELNFDSGCNWTYNKLSRQTEQTTSYQYQTPIKL